MLSLPPPSDRVYDSAMAPLQKAQDRQTYQVGIAFVVPGLLATLVFWRLRILSLEVFDVPLGAGSTSCVLAGLAFLIAPSYGAWYRARCIARGVDPSRRFLDRLALLVAPKKREPPRKLRQGEALKQFGGIAVLICTFTFVVEEVVERVASWKETTCNVQIVGPGRVRATYKEGFRTLSFTGAGVGTPSGAVSCYVRPNAKFGEGTFQRPTGGRIPRSSGFTLVLVLMLVTGLALLGLGYARARARI